MENLTGHSQCPNCDFILEEGFEFCPNCGQKILKKSDFSFRHLIVDSIGDYFHFDGKFLHSLVPLIISPGKMTLEYLQGKRAKFIQPFKLVLVLSVIYFIVVGLTLKIGTKYSASLTMGNDSTAIPKNEQKSDLNFNITYGDKTMPLDSVQSAIKEKGMDKFLHDLDPEASWFTRAIAFQVINFAIEGPDVFIKKLVHNSSKVIFVLIPFVALLFKLLYIRKKRLYFDHLIFSMHFHAFFFILLLFYQMIDSWLFSVPIWIILLIIFAYLLLAMKKVYQQNWFLSCLKMLSMVLLYLLIAMPFFLIVLFIVSVML